MPKSEDIQYFMLIVSASEQFVPFVKKSVSGISFAAVDHKKNAEAARRSILERYYDLVVIDAPLPDGNADEFALDIVGNCDVSVLLIVPRDFYEDSLERVAKQGVLVLPKPAPRGRMEKALGFMIAARRKIHVLEGKLRNAEDRLEELRIVTRAKFLLMERDGMTEEEAHRFIGKEAMDNGVSRGRIAERILDE